MSAQPPGPNESAREQLLASARQLVLARFREGVAPHHALAYLTPAAVAAHAGVSRGTIYHHWGGDTGEDGYDRPFERFLAEVAQMFWTDAVAVDDIELLAEALPDNLTDMILELTAFELDRLSRGEDAAMFRASTTMVLHGVDLAAQFRDSIDQLALLYGLGLRRIGRQVRAPLTNEHFARAMAALAAGMLLEELHLPGSAAQTVEWCGEVPRSTSERPWTLFAVVAEGVALHMTEPVADASE
ncbi:MAG: TetR/AcrR family transcriptional regulator [Microthrixaceae bacterium]